MSNEEFPFITSDNFMHLYHPEIQGFFGVGLGTHNVRVHIPISQKLSLMLINNPDLQDKLIWNITNPPTSKDGGEINIRLLIESLNKAIFIKCDKYIFSSSNSQGQAFSKILEEAKVIEEKLIEEKISEKKRLKGLGALDLSDTRIFLARFVFIF